MEYLVARNPRVKLLRRLVSNSRDRRREGLFVLEHPVAIGELLRGSQRFRADAVWVDDARAYRHHDLLNAAERAGVPVIALTDGVFDSISDTVAAPGILATVRRERQSLLVRSSPQGQARDRLGSNDGPEPALPVFDIVLVDVSDPGNAGAIVRAAEGMGATRVVATAGSVDLFSPKAVRATTGSILRVPVVTDVASGEVVDHYAACEVATLAMVATGGISPEDLPDSVVSQGLALLVGSESHGLADDVVAGADHRVTVPLLGGVESLNAAVATAVIGFDIARRRRRPRPQPSI